MRFRVKAFLLPTCFRSPAILFQYFILMKTKKSRIEKFKKIAQLFNEYQSTLAVVSHDAARVAAFNAIVDELRHLESALIVPLQVIIQQRVVLNTRIKEEVLPALSRAMSLSGMLNDPTMTNTLGFYYKGLRSKPTAAMASHAAKVVLDFVEQHATEAAGVGFDAAGIAALSQLTDDTEGMREHAHQRGSLRRVDRGKMQRLLSEATMMLRNEFDWMVVKHKSTAPVLYERYRMLRQVKKGSSTTTAESTELSGTVTDALSGEAIRGAGVQLLDVSGFEATTDVDGYYLIDELLPGSYLLRCTAAGYQPANDVAFTIAKGEALEVNFSLTAQQAVA